MVIIIAIKIFGSQVNNAGFFSSVNGSCYSREEYPEVFRKASIQREMQTFKSQGCYLMGKLVPLSYNARNKICNLKKKKMEYCSCM